MKLFVYGYSYHTSHDKSGSSDAGRIRVLAHDQNLADVSHDDLQSSQNGNGSGTDNLERRCHTEISGNADQTDPNE